MKNKNQIGKNQTITVKNTKITILQSEEGDYISLTDMLQAKDGDFFISDWLRNRNTVEFLGIWESVYNPNFNYGEFAIIKSKAGLNNYKISVKDWQEKTNSSRFFDKSATNNFICEIAISLSFFNRSGCFFPSEINNAFKFSKLDKQFQSIP